MAYEIYQGDCLEVLKQYPDSYFDSIVTDPPYELGFMGKKWDSTGIAYNIELWQEVLRVLKPGGHLLAFGGTRTYHRMACAIEDAGFEIRDCIQWIYATGFPKSYNLAKGIEGKLTLGSASWNDWKTLNGEKEIVSWGYSKLQSEQKYRPNDYTEKNKQRVGKVNYSTEEAIQWDGWGTALKPANEPIVLARKPLSEKTVAENVLKWGTGGINIDGCRIELNGEKNPSIARYNSTPQKGNNGWEHKNRGGNFNEQTKKSMEQGRFPANVILDEEAGKLLDGQSGISKSTGGTGEKSKQWDNGVIGWKGQATGGFGDTGGASRFFYCAKASKKERGDSKHPTVKPLSLMRYLCRLITPPEGIVLDPFAGSGTTLEAAILEGFNVVGIEKEHDYIPDIRRRIERAQLNTQALDMGIILFSEEAKS